VTAEDAFAAEPQVRGPRAQGQIGFEVGRRVDVREEPLVSPSAYDAG
jgi:hypothetical protein